MTSLLRRKPRTTVPRTRARTACRLALLLALVGGPVAAQYPGRQPQSRPTPPQSSVMYYHKPADAIIPAPAAVPQAAPQRLPTAAQPDVSSAPPRTLPPPVVIVDHWERPGARTAALVAARQQDKDKKPDEKKDEKKDEKSWAEKEKEDREKYLRLPPRDLVFA